MLDEAEESIEETNQELNEQSEQENLYEAATIELGLGDYIFYSVLMGKACEEGDWNITLACFLAIMFGLFLTLMLQAIYQKAVPGLPIPILLGLISIYIAREVYTPFLDQYQIKQIFI